MRQVRRRVLLKAAPVPVRLRKRFYTPSIPAGEAASGGEVEGQAGGTNLPHLEFICYGMKRFAARRIHLRRQEKICCTENLFAAAGKNLQHGEFIRGGRKTFAARRIHLRGQEKICGAGNALAVISKNLPPEELIPGGWKKSAARGIYLWR